MNQTKKAKGYVVEVFHAHQNTLDSHVYQTVADALKVLENMRHRGAEGADGRTGDGAGIMLQIPHEFILLQDRVLP